MPFLYSFVKFSKRPRKGTSQTQNIALAYQKTLNIWFPRWYLMRKRFANKLKIYFNIGKKWWKSIFFLYVDFDNRERVSWHQISFYIKWWVFVMIIKPWLYVINTFVCHYKPIQKCIIGFGTPCDYILEIDSICWQHF